MTHRRTAALRAALLGGAGLLCAAHAAAAYPLTPDFIARVAAGAYAPPDLLEAPNVPLVRIAPADRGPDGAPGGADRPSPRALSNALSAAVMARPDPAPLSVFGVGWAQFTMSHDLARSPVMEGPEGALDLPVAADDPIAHDLDGVPVMRQQRSMRDPVTGEPFSDVTPFLDGSTIYGSTPERAAFLRANDGTGRLREAPDGGLLIVDGRRIAGDVRADENIVLQSIHELMMKEHNRLAGEVSAGCAAAGVRCTEDEIFGAARALNVAGQQKVLFEEFVPAFLGTADLASLVPDAALLDGPGIVLNEFTAAAGRIGHTKIPARIEAGLPGGPRVSQPIETCIFSATCLAGQDLASRLHGAMTQPSDPVDTVVVPALRDALLEAAGGDVLIDLLATNINRGRDHGLADYMTVRSVLGFPDVPMEALLPPEVVTLYAGATGVDLLVGLFAEERRPGAQLGETASAIWALQLARLTRDPHFYTALLGDPIAEMMEGWGMADIVAANTSLARAEVGDPFRALAPVPLPPAAAGTGLGLLILAALRRRTGGRAGAPDGRPARV